ncbi:hypothetical protein [Micromonospora wenchangensis]|uniref:hypothetical protein n=1 Tax=Micromonospora wenchangensis TaxID=1185415 RepID=UPI003811E6BA
MASSGNREEGELKTLADDAARVADGLGAVASRRIAAVTKGVVVTQVVLAAIIVVAALVNSTFASYIFRSTPSAFAALGGSFVSLIASLVILKGGGERNAGLRPESGGAVLLRGAAGLLPGWAACRYREEWAGELYDLRAEGAPWWTRVGYLLGVLLCALRLAVGLRLGGERSRA